MADRNDTLGGSSSSPAGERGTTEKMKDTAHEAQEKASQVAAKAKDKGEDLADQGREKAEELAHRAGDMAKSRADEEKVRVASGIRTVADALRRGGNDLPEDRQTYGRFVETVADRAEGLSRYLEERDVDDMAREAQRFAREHTGVVISGAFALGLLGARFLKSSSDDARGQRWDYSDRELGGGYQAGYGTDMGYTETGGYDRAGGYSRAELHTRTRGVSEPRYELDADRPVRGEGADGLATDDADIDRASGLGQTDDIGRTTGGDDSIGRMGGA